MESDEMTYAEWAESASEVSATAMGLDPASDPPDTFLHHGVIYHAMRFDEHNGHPVVLYRKEDGKAVEVYFV